MRVVVTARLPVSLELEIEGDPGPNLEDRVNAALEEVAQQMTVTGYLAEWMVTEGGGWDITITKENA